MGVEAEPGKVLPDVWVYLTPEEARDLLVALQFWAEEDPKDPGWHTHIASDDGELTIAVEAD